MPDDLIQRRLPLTVETSRASRDHAARTSAYGGQRAAQSADNAAIEGVLHVCGRFEASAVEARFGDEPLDDGHLLKGERILNVVNDPSPAATASLAIGERIVAELAGTRG